MSAMPFASCSIRVVNIGNNEPVQLTDFIDAIEVATGKSKKGFDADAGRRCACDLGIRRYCEL